jgi:hypothetical protein
LHPVQLGLVLSPQDPEVHILQSPQSVLSALFGWAQFPEEQASLVHMFPSSGQEVPSATLVCVQEELSVPGFTQVSVVQGFASSQSALELQVIWVHLPFEQIHFAP